MGTLTAPTRPMAMSNVMYRVLLRPTMATLSPFPIPMEWKAPAAASISPRTYPRLWYTHSTLGGWFGPELKYAGLDGIVVHGKSDSPVYLEIRDGEAQLIGASDLWGHDARKTQLVLKKRVGEQAQVLTIGPAGENLVRFASVQHAEDNAAGHSGFGAVWGSTCACSPTRFLSANCVSRASRPQRSLALTN